MFLFVVDHGDRVDEPVVDQSGDILDVLGPFVPVADDKGILVQHPAVVQRIDDVDVVGRRGFEVDLVLERLFEHEAEVRTFGAVAIVVAAPVIDLGHRHVEDLLGPLDLRTDLGQVGDLQRGPVLFDDVHQRYVVELETAVHHGKFILGELESLLDEVDIFVLHLRRIGRLRVRRLRCFALCRAIRLRWIAL